MRHIRSYTLILLLTLLSGMAAAQGPTARLKSSPMLAGSETLTFDLSYSVAFIKGSVGTATLTTTPTSGGSCTTQLLLRTKNAVETFFPMRDTMQTWYGADRLPQRFYKGIDENKYRMRDEVTYRFTPKTAFTSARQYHDDGTLRESRDSRIDATSAAVLDLISMVAYVRAIPEEELAATKSGERFIIPLGKELTEGRFTFIGYKMRKYQGKSVSTMEVSFDIGDPGFKKNRDTLRLYITRDAKRLPIFARAELAIGAVDCRLVSDK
ncbi:DUF3108 domain-containing protein [Porphyromonas sp. HMSC065F10]|uniref:DUF3108 domain-containing protein n=1 Tax=Porphyromonas sp. HMSC065F10 TaxID=1739394 RepID=UPI0008A5096F|nr:DUF3108 domain-containing protein [Porphyromonas sp. HMSC065F10]OFR41130.1 hypothetical protein HMPREF2890_00730 [Porphyromonas sp. HMSC065F10]